jgi:hypothetical protein
MLKPKVRNDGCTPRLATRSTEKSEALSYNLFVAMTPSDSAIGLENVERLLIEFFRNSDASHNTQGPGNASPLRSECHC